MTEDLDPIETEESETPEPETLETSSSGFVAGAVAATIAVPVIYVAAKETASRIHARWLSYKAKKNVVLVINENPTEPEPKEEE